jgi:hypothetical protein
MRRSTGKFQGPLLNTSAEIIGINSAIVSSANGGNVGIGFAIPVDTVRRITNDLITYGYVKRPSWASRTPGLSDYPQLRGYWALSPRDYRRGRRTGFRCRVGRNPAYAK